jgi:hypothetical protein
MGPGLDFRPWPDHAQGLGLGQVAQIIFGSRLNLCLVQMIAIRHYIGHFGLSQAILFSAKKVICRCAHCILMTELCCGNKSN